MIARNAERLARLTNDLLDLSRIESRQWPVKLEPVSVEATARRAVEVCAESARRKRIELASRCRRAPRCSPMPAPSSRCSSTCSTTP